MSDLSTCYSSSSTILPASFYNVRRTDENRMNDRVWQNQGLVEMSQVQIQYPMIPLTTRQSLFLQTPVAQRDFYATTYQPAGHQTAWNAQRGSVAQFDVDVDTFLHGNRGNKCKGDGSHREVIHAMTSCQPMMVPFSSTCEEGNVREMHPQLNATFSVESPYCNEGDPPVKSDTIFNQSTRLRVRRPDLTFT